MVTATLTSKGQLTIPKAVRDSLHLRTGDRVAFIVHGDTEAVLKPVTKSVDEVFGRLHSASQPCKTVDEMKAAVAERLRERRRRPGGYHHRSLGRSLWVRCWNHV